MRSPRGGMEKYTHWKGKEIVIAFIGDGRIIFGLRTPGGGYVTSPLAEVRADGVSDCPQVLCEYLGHLLAEGEVKKGAKLKDIRSTCWPLELEEFRYAGQCPGRREISATVIRKGKRPKVVAVYEDCEYY